MHKLRKYLDDRGLRYGWFAEHELGMSRSYFSSVLKGHVKLPQKYWKQIVIATEGEIQLEDLLNDNEQS